MALAAGDVQAGAGRPAGTAVVAPLNGTGYVALTPARLLDTRVGGATIDGIEAGGGAVGAGQTVTTTVAGRGGVPSTGVGAVALHVTAVDQTVRGYVTVFPTGIALPGTSNLNPIPGAVSSNLVIVPVGAGGKVSLFNSDGTTQLIVDVEGWYPTGSAFHGLTPTRVVDTRPTSTKLGAHETLPVQLAGVAGVPSSGVSAVVLNLTSVGATASTFLTVHASGSPMPATSNLNVQPAVAGANLVVVPVGADGKVSIVNDAGTVHVVVDVLGWYSSGPGFNPVAPARVADTRSGQPLGPHATRTFQITGNGGVPLAGAGSVVFNLTAARQTERTFLTVFPTGSARPLSSDLNPQPNVVAPNLVIAKLGPDGTVSIYNESGTVDVIIDVVGWQPSFVEARDDTATITEDAPATVIPVLANDVDHDGHPLQVASVTQPANGTAAVVGGGMAVSYTPPANFCNAFSATTVAQPATFQYTLYGGMTATVSVHVTCVDDAPVAVDDSATVIEDAAPTPVLVLSNDTDVDGGSLTISSVTQPANGTVALTGGVPGAATGLTYQPNANYCNSPGGSADTFTYMLNGGDTATVAVAVTCVDDLPTAVDDSVTVDEDAAATLPVLANDTDTDGGPLAIGSVTQPASGAVVISLGSLIYTPAAEYCNSPVGFPDTFTYTLNGGSTATVSVAVLCVNDAPSFSKGANQTVLEDAGAQTVNGWATSISAGPPNESAQTVAFNVTGNSNVALFSVAPTVSPTGTLTYTPAADANGVATITLSAADDGGSANGGADTSAAQSFTITVTAVNDVPTFAKGANQTVLEDAGAQSVNGWATSISAGPANESAQTVSFSVTGNTNAALFSVAPAISPTGVLTYTPVADANGVATITLSVADSGGTANGGVDTSATQSFTITVTAVNDVPTFTKGANQSVDEDAGAQTVNGWATAVGAGPANESAQALSFEITGNTNAMLFSTAPDVSPSGALTYTPAADANGTATITLRLADDGGTADGGVDTSATQSFTITVTAVNDVPAFDLPLLPDQWVLQDSPEQTVPGFVTNIFSGPANESGQTMTFHVSNNFNGLFSAQPTIDEVTGDLVYTPAAGQTGTATVSVYLTDDGGTANGGVDRSATATFDIVVSPPNATPVAQSKTGANAVGLLEDGFNMITLVATDADDDPLTFQISTQPLHGTLGSLTSVDCSGANMCTVSVLYTPNADFVGSDSFEFRVNDGTINSNVATVELTVTAVNDVPSFTKGSNQSVSEDSGTVTVNGWATDRSTGPADETWQTLTFNVVGNTNPTLFAFGPAVSTTGVLTFTPAADANGTATVTLTASDNGGTSNGGVDTSATQTFTINVAAVNDAPSFMEGPDRWAYEDSGATLVPLWATSISAGPVNEAVQTVTFSVTGNTNASLFSAGPAVASNGTLTFTPAADANGSATITLTISDSGGTANGGVDTSAPQSFTITVIPVNDAPSFTKGSDRTVLEDSGAASVTNWATSISAGPAEESAQTVSFNVIGNTNPGLFSVGPAVASDGTLTFTPAANANGSATVTLNLSDNGGGGNMSAPQSFTINVTAVNDAPSFTKGTDQTVSEDSAAVTVTNWATPISAGPADESGQTVTFSASNTNNALFSAQPAVSSNGTLTFTPAANANGSATVTLTLSDNGGIANGGANTSASQNFTITVTAVNDAPTSAGRAYGAGSLQTNMQSSFVAAGGLLVDAADAADVAGNAAYTPVLTVGAINSVTPVAGTITTTITGVGTIVANSATGAFTLDPAAGVTGNVSFTYTVCDSGDGSPASQCSAAATASFDIAGPQIWFVNTAVATTGNGTLTHPFKTLAEADAVDGDGDGVFVYSGTTVTGLQLNSGEYLVGQAASGSFDSAFGITPPTTTIARPTLAGSPVTIGGTVTLASNAKLQGVSISSAAAPGLVGAGSINNVTVSETSVTTTTGTAVSLTNAVGTYSLSSVSTNGAASGILIDGVGASNITVTGGSIVGATSRGVDINGGSGNVSYGGTITTSDTGRSVEITNRTGGTASFTGGISDSGLGLNLASNSGATILLSGVTANTAANTAFTATGGGAITLAGSSNTLTTTTGTALSLDNISSASTITVATVTTNGAANGVLINNIGGATVTINGGAIGGATTRGVDINGGGGAFTYAGTITTTSTGRSVEVTGHSSATVLFSGAVNDSGIGVNLTGNTGSTVNFTGGLTASTGGNTAFNATGGGTINVTGSANTLTTTTGTALNVANTTIGSSGLTFRSISVNGAAKGIVLDTTGSTAGLTVTGNGGTCTTGNTTGCSGGEIRSTTGADDSGATPAGTGIVLRSTKAPSFTRMYIHDHSNYGIRGTAVDGFTLDSSVVSGVNGSNAASPYNDASIAFDNLTGSATISNSAISGGYADNIRVRNDSGTLDRLTLNTVTVGDNSAADGNDGVLLVSSGSATFKVSVLSSTFTGARGDVLQFNHGGSGAGDLVLTNSHFSNNHSGIATGGGGLTLSNEGTSGATTMNITGNTFRDAVGPGVLIVKATGASVQTGTFSNNTIGVSGAANSGSAEGSALKLQTVGQGTLGWTVTNNQIYGYNNNGIEVLAGGSASAQSGTVNMTITGNTIAEPGNTAGTLGIPKNGIHLNIGTVPGDTYSACAAIGGAGALQNNVFNGGADASPPVGGGQDIRIRQRQNTTVRLPNYAGAANADTAAQNFLVANNSSGGVPTAITSNTSGSGGGGFTGGAAPCS